MLLVDYEHIQLSGCAISQLLRFSSRLICCYFSRSFFDLWSCLPSWCIQGKNHNNLLLDLNTSKSENSHHALYALINAHMHNWTTLNFIFISLSLLHNPLMGFTIWLGRTSSGPTWTWSPNDLIDSRKIYENLLQHRSNDMDLWSASPSPNLPSG